MNEQQPSVLTEEEIDAAVVDVQRQTVDLYNRMARLLVERVIRRVLHDYPEAREIRLSEPEFDGQAMWLHSITMADKSVVTRDNAVGELIDGLDEDLYDDLSTLAEVNGIEARLILVADHAITEE